MNYVTRSQVFHNGLDESIHRIEIKYPDETLTYVFSSELYMNIFYKKVNDHRKKINNSLSKRFALDIEIDKLADVKLYTITEKRGFLILGKEEFRCLDNLKLTGVNLMKQN